MKQKWVPYKDDGRKAKDAKEAVSDLLEELIEDIERDEYRKRPYYHRDSKKKRNKASKENK